MKNQDIKIKMDPILFYRMLENILKNSLTYTNGKIMLIISDSNHMINITILDEGSGLDENIIEKIYKEDLTNIRRHGLGILISKQIAQLHEGKFIIKNKKPGLEISFIFAYHD